MLINACFLQTEMITLDAKMTIPYMFTSIIATICVLGLCKSIEQNSILERMLGRVLFTNKASLTILALHFICFKLVSVVKMSFQNLPPEALSMVPIIRENNDLWWILYSFIGVSIPCMFYMLYCKTRLS